MDKHTEFIELLKQYQSKVAYNGRLEIYLDGDTIRLALIWSLKNIGDYRADVRADLNSMAKADVDVIEELIEEINEVLEKLLDMGFELEDSTDFRGFDITLN